MQLCTEAEESRRKGTQLISSAMKRAASLYSPLGTYAAAENLEHKLETGDARAVDYLYLGLGINEQRRLILPQNMGQPLCTDSAACYSLWGGAPRSVVDDVVRSADQPFAPGSLSAAKQWTKSSRLRAYQRDYNLPTKRGKIRYIPPDSWSPNQALPRGNSGGFIDKFGNEWKKGPTRTAGELWEWDVQIGPNATAGFKAFASGGTHVNVSWLGEITHVAQ